MINNENINFYKQADIERITVADASIAVRHFGKGEPIIFIHGFPTNGYTWRHVIPILSEQFHCITVDLPGLGDSTWSDKTDFSSNAQAEYVIEVLKQLGLKKYSLAAHNSGATIARIIAIKQSEKTQNLILFNTEIPNHRPPWIEFYQKIGLLPFVPNVIRILLKQKWFIKSSMGFKEAYYDKKMLDIDDNIQHYLFPFFKSKEKTIGAFRYLKGIDWKIVDNFERTHKKIKAGTLFIWGKTDKTFPLKYALTMKSQFNPMPGFVEIENASLLPHEEKPKEVCEAIFDFLK